jgi:hypothetical protein
VLQHVENESTDFQQLYVIDYYDDDIRLVICKKNQV